MDALREYFHNTYGITKIPLLYVVCKQEAPMDEPEGHWEDPLMQMIDRAPHWVLAAQGVGAVHHPSYMVDNKMVLTNWQRYVALTVAGHISNHSCTDTMVDQPSWA